MVILTSKRVSSIAPSATLAIDSKAKQLKKEGKNVLNFGAGEPDFTTPINIKEAAKRAIENNITRYTPIGGIAELREAISKNFRDYNKINYDPSEVIVASGGKHVLYSIAESILDDGDEAILPVPYWVSFEEMIKLAGAKPILCKTNDSFKLTANDIQENISGKTKMLILNSPNNPSGAVVEKKEMEKIAKLAIEHNFFIVSNEVYDHFVYDGKEICSIASLNGEIRNLTITVNSFSKTYAMTGWRVGYCGASREIIKSMENFQSHAFGNVSNISQMAALEALKGPQDSVGEMVISFNERRKFIHKRLNEIPGVKCNNPEGAFYAFPNIEGTGMGSMDISSGLLADAMVAVVPGTAFGLEGHIRLSYATSMKDIQEGMDKMEKWVKSKLKQ